MFGWLARLLRRVGIGPGRERQPAGAARNAPPDISPSSAGLGPRSEQLAGEFLQRAGFRILAANYRCPLGELDLVARGEGKLVFVEVKARRSAAGDAGPPARPELAVHRGKQKKIGRAAKYFCRANRCQDEPVRFDVIAVDWPADAGPPVIRHHKAAFRPDV